MAESHGWDKTRLWPTVATNGEAEVVGGLNLPGTVMLRVVSSRNFSVQYTDGLECIQSWLRVREAGAEAS